MNDRWLALPIFVGVFLPTLVGLVTTKLTASSIQAVILLALSAITALGAEIITAHQANQSFDFVQLALTAIATFITAVGVHFGFLKPTGISAALQGVEITHPISPDPPAPPVKRVAAKRVYKPRTPKKPEV